jgi:hypothetical protein
MTGTTTYHAHVSFDETEDASAEMVGKLFEHRGWRLDDCTPGEVFVEIDTTEADADQRLKDLTSLVAEAGFTNIYVTGPVSNEELYS